jgi:hypothetical protein
MLHERQIPGEIRDHRAREMLPAKDDQSVQALGLVRNGESLGVNG